MRLHHLVCTSAIRQGLSGQSIGWIWDPFPDSFRTAWARSPVENVRLFKALQTRTEELTRSVNQLTALGEVGRAVSSTLDLETVLTTIVSRAVELSRLDGGVVFEYDERTEEFVQRAMTDTGEALAEARRATRIRKGEGVLVPTRDDYGTSSLRRASGRSSRCRWSARAI